MTQAERDAADDAAAEEAQREVDEIVAGAVARERKRCLAICKQVYQSCSFGHSDANDSYRRGGEVAARQIHDGIASP